MADGVMSTNALEDSLDYCLVISEFIRKRIQRHALLGHIFYPRPEVVRALRE